MDTRQTLLVLGAVVIFSITALITNSEILESSEVMTETQVLNGAAAIGLSCIENLKTYGFDEALVNDPDVEDTGMLTLPGSLGPEPGETIANFDDIDDFNNRTDTVETQLVEYIVNTSIVYVDTTDLTAAAGYRTYYKELRVKVYTPFMSDTLRMSHIFCHWK